MCCYINYSVLNFFRALNNVDFKQPLISRILPLKIMQCKSFPIACFFNWKV
jgi:hypothetical protein